MKSRTRFRAVMAGLLLATPICAQNTAPVRPARYLSGAEMPDMIRIVPPAPVAGDARDVSDRAIFKATRSFEGTARWTLSQTDNDLSAPGLLKAFGCAMGLSLDAQAAPRLATLVSRSSADGNAGINSVKELYQRKRPFIIDQGGICIPLNSASLNSSDYPSGHATVGWAVGLILSELVPDRASDILVRARAYGESRVICGVHSASSVEASRTAGSAIVAALHRSAAFRGDLEAARTELAALGVPSSVASQACGSEAATIAPGLAPVR